MNLEFAKTILMRLRGTGQGVTGNEHYRLLGYGFYDFEEELGLSKKDYEKLVLDMGKEGWIKIDYKNGIAYEHAIIFATIDGMQFLNGGSDK